MSYAEAIAALNDEFMQGDIDADHYELERQAIEYAYGEQQSARDEQEGVAA